MPTIKLEWNEFVIAYKFDVYSKLMDFVERQINEDLVTLAREAGGAASQPEDYPGLYDYQDHLAEEYAEREHHMAIFMHALFASSFALFEHELVRVCEWARKEANCQSSVMDLGRRDYMNNAKQYLKKLGVAIPTGSFEWNQATSHRKIRNSIVHAGSRLRKSDTNITCFARRNGILDETSSINGDVQLELQLTRDYCRKAIKDFRRVLIDVSSVYQQWKKSNRPAAEVASPTPSSHTK